MEILCNTGNGGTLCCAVGQCRRPIALRLASISRRTANGCHMDHDKRRQLVYPASVGAAVGIGMSATRSFEVYLGTPLGLIGGALVAGAVGYIVAIMLQPFFPCRTGQAGEPTENTSEHQ